MSALKSTCLRARAATAASSWRGIRPRGKSVGDSREASGLERCIGHGRRRCVLRHDGSLVQSGRCQGRTSALAVQGGVGFIGQPVSYRGSDGQQYVAILSGVGVGRARWQMPRSIRACATPRLALQALPRICRSTRRAAANCSSSGWAIRRRTTIMRRLGNGVTVAVATMVALTSHIMAATLRASGLRRPKQHAVFQQRAARI